METLFFVILLLQGESSILSYGDGRGPLNPDFRRAELAFRLDKIRLDYADDEESFYRSLRLPNGDERSKEEFVNRLDRHPIEDYIIQLERLQADAEERGYLSIQSAAAVDRILLRGHFITASTDVEFVRPLLKDLVENHIASPELLRLVESHEALSWMLDLETTESFLETLSRTSPHPTIQARASLALARRLVERWHGLSLEDATRRGLSEEIEALLESVRTNYAHDTAADEASFELYSFRNLRVGGRPEPYSQQGKRDQNESNISLLDYQGRIVLVQFWAQWSGPSQTRLLETRRLVERYQRRPFVVVSVNCDAYESTPLTHLQTLLTELKLTDSVDRAGIVWHHVADGPPQGVFAREWNIHHWPANFVLDSKGVIQVRNTWGEELESHLDRLLLECEEDIFLRRHLDLEKKEIRRFSSKSPTIGGTQAYLATPEDGGENISSAIIIPDAFGLTDHMKLWADRLTTLGIAALVVDPFERKKAKTLDEARLLAEAIPSEEDVIELIKEAINLLVNDPGIRSEKILIFGWGWGGEFALHTAKGHQNVVGSVVFGSELSKNLSAEILNNKKPSLLLVGDRCWDRGPMAAVNAAAGEQKSSTLFVFEDAEARFDAPTHPIDPVPSSDYHRPSAIAAWEKIIAFVHDTMQAH